MVASVLVKGGSGNSLLPKESMTTTRDPLAGTVYTETLRGVRCVRLSVLTDETTSPERQREADDIAAGALNIAFGEGDGLREAVDLDVSASKISRSTVPRSAHGSPARTSSTRWSGGASTVPSGP